MCVHVCIRNPKISGFCGEVVRVNESRSLLDWLWAYHATGKAHLNCGRIHWSDYSTWYWTIENGRLVRVSRRRWKILMPSSVQSKEVRVQGVWSFCCPFFTSLLRNLASLSAPWLTKETHLIEDVLGKVNIFLFSDEISQNIRSRKRMSLRYYQITSNYIKLLLLRDLFHGNDYLEGVFDWKRKKKIFGDIPPAVPLAGLNTRVRAPRFMPSVPYFMATG